MWPLGPSLGKSSVANSVWLHERSIHFVQPYRGATLLLGCSHDPDDTITPASACRAAKAQPMTLPGPGIAESLVECVLITLLDSTPVTNV